MRHAEKISRILITAGVLITLVVPLAIHFYSGRGMVEIHGRTPEAGGWSPNTIHAQVGVPLYLRLTSDDVMHGFAIGKSKSPAVDVAPGKMTEVTVTFNKPGTYTFYCTRWCGPNHWRMRGTIEVSGGNTGTPEPVSVPLYMTLNLNIDAPHPAPVIPSERPSALRGSAYANMLTSIYLTSDYYRSHSPAQVYQDLRKDFMLSSLSNANLWDLVAYIWQFNIQPNGLAEGQRLYKQNCAACHGELGGGDGVFALNVKAQTGKSPASFTNPTTLLGASPALLQGKILRGGMGTGMPYWGPIFEKETIWSIIGYIYTFQYDQNIK